MSENLVLDLSMQFAIDIVNLCETLKGKNSLTNQLLRSGTSIGANIHEANYASSRADFIAKCRSPLKNVMRPNIGLSCLLRRTFFRKSNINPWKIPVAKSENSSSPRLTPPKVMLINKRLDTSFWSDPWWCVCFCWHYPSYISGELNISELARVCNMSRTRVYRYIKILK